MLPAATCYAEVATAYKSCAFCLVAAGVPEGGHVVQDVKFGIDR